MSSKRFTKLASLSMLLLTFTVSGCTATVELPSEATASNPTAIENETSAQAGTETICESEETSSPIGYVIPETYEPSELTESHADASCLSEEQLHMLAREFEITRQIVPASEIVNYERLDVPEEINGFSICFTKFYDGKSMFIYLEDGSKVNEIGKLNIFSGEYETLFTMPDERAYNLCAVSDDYLVIQIASDTWWTDGELYLYDIADQRLDLICDYPKDEAGHVYAQHFNNIAMKDGKVYYDVFYEDGGELRASLYEYNISAGESVKLVDDAQNPMEYKDDILYFAKRDGEYTTVASMNGSIEDIKVQDELMDIAIGEDGFYSITGIYENYATTWHLTMLNDGDYILKSIPTYSLDDVELRNGLVTISYGFDNVPLLYDIESDSVAVFNDLYSHYAWIRGDANDILWVSDWESHGYYLVTRK